MKKTNSIRYYKTRNRVVEAEQVTEDQWVIDASGVPMLVFKGDYIVYDALGRVWAKSKVEFENLYEEFD